jgi:hypothetical protein
MSGGRTPRVGLPTRFQSALEKLSTLFAMALWDAKANSCAEAWSEIKKLKSAKRKNEVIDARAQQWREESAKAIRNWSPKFVQFADACSEALDRDILDWCRDKIWQKIETQCGIHKPNVGQLPRGTCSRSRVVVGCGIGRKSKYSPATIKALDAPALAGWGWQGKGFIT